MNGGIPSDAAVRGVAILAILRRYLVLDKISMISKVFFAKLSTVLDMISNALGNDSKGRPFGGLNVNIVGDFHQFPPVACKENTPLYWPLNVNKDRTDKILGRQLFKKFEHVVIMREQVHVVDPVWLDFLRHARRGECQPHHLVMLQKLKLVLTNWECSPMDFMQAPWNGAILITPCHAMRML